MSCLARLHHIWPRHWAILTIYLPSPHLGFGSGSGSGSTLRNSKLPTLAPDSPAANPGRISSQPASFILPSSKLTLSLPFPLISTIRVCRKGSPDSDSGGRYSTSTGDTDDNGSQLVPNSLDTTQPSYMSAAPRPLGSGGGGKLSRKIRKVSNSKIHAENRSA